MTAGHSFGAQAANASSVAGAGGGGGGMGAGDWATIIQGIGQGAQTAMQGTAQAAASRQEAREAKRRTLANLLNNALKRNQGMYRVGQEYGDEMNDYQSQAMQQMARGFIDNLTGSTGRM